MHLYRIHVLVHQIAASQELIYEIRTIVQIYAVLLGRYSAVLDVDRRIPLYAALRFLLYGADGAQYVERLSCIVAVVRSNGLAFLVDNGDEGSVVVERLEPYHYEYIIFGSNALVACLPESIGTSKLWKKIFHYIW